jgi:hypothetical protein
MVVGVSFDGVLEFFKLKAVGYFDQDRHDFHLAPRENSKTKGPGPLSPQDLLGLFLF